MTILLYVRRKGWLIRSLTVECTHQREAVTDFERVNETENSLMDVIGRTIRLDGDLSPEQIDRIAYIATRCPIHRIMESKPLIRDSIIMQ